MKLIIFGATGTIGKQIVLQALSLEHEVTVFVRNASGMSEMNHEHLSIFKGDVLDLSTVKNAVKDQDTVICALGAGRKGTVRSEGTRCIVTAMELHGIKRFICLSTIGAGDSRGNLNFFWKYIMFGWFLKEAYHE